MSYSVSLLAPKFSIVWSSHPIPLVYIYIARSLLRLSLLLILILVESDLVQLGEDKFLRSLIVLSAGPMAMLFTFGVNYYCTLWTIRAARRTE